MGRRIVRAGTIASAVLFVGTIFLTIASYWISPWQHYLSISEHIHIGVWDIGRPSLVAFNNSDLGPYRGSIIQISYGPGEVYPELIKTEFGDAWGIYYRHFFAPADGSTLWTLAVACWYPLGLFATLPLAWCIQNRRKLQQRLLPGRNGAGR